MNGKTFYQKITDHGELSWHSSVEGDSTNQDHVVIRNDRFHTNFAVPIAEIIAHSWNVLEDILTLKRPPHIMSHITRIVGYYSNLNNWNASKVAELKDRHKGDYDVHESKKESPVAELVA